LKFLGLECSYVYNLEIFLINTDVHKPLPTIRKKNSYIIKNLEWKIYIFELIKVYCKGHLGKELTSVQISYGVKSFHGDS